MAISTGSGSGNLASEINVTPLVDVMLVLLIIFMVTAPMLNAAVDLDLPETKATKVDDREGKLILRINKDRQLQLSGTDVKWSELFDKLSTNRKLQTERELYIEAHKNLPYGVVVRAMSIAQDAGASKLQMVTDPNAPEDPIETWDAPPSGSPTAP